MSGTFTLHRPVEDDWADVRELRLRMVADTPIAFLERLDDLVQVTEDDWRGRVRRNRQPENRQIVAIDESGRWIANMTVFISQGPPSYLGKPVGGPPRANLVGVFVDPEWRGPTGVNDAVLGALCDWVMNEQGLDKLWLHVSLENPRARRSYEKRGFRATGVIEVIPGDLSSGDAEMVADLPLRLLTAR